MAKFFWGSDGLKRKIHWRNWASMCTPKCEGGMGFKDLTVFNEALLGRQGWRLVNGDNTLLGRVMKSKYYPNCSFLDSALGYSCSYSWKSIWGSKSIIKEGIIWRVGNGARINIWRDPWLTDELGRFVTTDPTDELSLVSELIDHSSMEWNLEVISNTFSERDKKCILAIPLSWRSPTDDLTWAYSKDGGYSVKTAYMLGKGLNFDALHTAWSVIWGLDVSPKVRHFLWRLCTNTLPVRALLHKRHLIDDGTCPWCNVVEETEGHAIFDCSRVRELWTVSECEELINWRSAGNMCELMLTWKQHKPAIQQKGAILAWCIWSATRKYLRTKPAQIQSL